MTGRLAAWVELVAVAVCSLIASLVLVAAAVLVAAVAIGAVQF